MSGVDTGVNPVPPSIRESKLKGMPLDGVVIGTPATSFEVFINEGVSTVLNCNESGRSFVSLAANIGNELGLLLFSKPTGNEFGRFGLVSIDSHLFGWRNGVLSMVTSDFIRGFMSGGDDERSRHTAR